MTDDPAVSIKRLRSRLEESDDIADDDADALLAFSNQIRLLGPSEFSDYAHEKYLMRLVAIAEGIGGVADALDDKQAAESIVAWINTEKNGSPETNKDYRVSLRRFGELSTEGDGMPDTIEWVPGGYPKNYDPAPDPSDMLRWDEDILPMIEGCHNHRDRAIIALAWDLGPRPHELYELRKGVFEDHRYGLQVTLDGKTGRRSPVLIPSVPYVRKWLDVHPGGHDDRFITKLTKPDSISNNRVRDLIKEAARRVGVERPVTPSNFRKSSASHLASEGVSQAHLEDHHGWRRGSDIAGRYIAVFSDSNTREIARAHGVDVEVDETEPIAPLTCPRCEKQTPRQKDFCVHCEQALDKEAKQLIDQVSQALDDQVIEADDPDTRSDLLRARRTLQAKPNVMDTDELHDLVSSLD